MLMNSSPPTFHILNTGDPAFAHNLVYEHHKKNCQKHSSKETNSSCKVSNATVSIYVDPRNKGKLLVQVKKAEGNGLNCSEMNTSLTAECNEVHPTIDYINSDTPHRALYEATFDKNGTLTSFVGPSTLEVSCLLCERFV